ncbi:hypothetical protein A9G45_01340 [Gilliamella sp. HK2]|jgi:hypothetical protein|uniref:hypothetical protein n=1 Tax=unclassified Gilliamella TaxID=2685620 RepID=UPI00080D952D|nr:hypothetical protein [Gilliamella apicola]OCG28963.1 hypothetical protein A9G46_01595 [Gilliamella apicola]OCG31439.1 hypothetical protein A9G45_01340 [Gilliamella apicola]
MTSFSRPKKIMAYDNKLLVKPRKLDVSSINNIIGMDVSSLFYSITDLSSEKFNKLIKSESFLRNLLIIYLKHSYVFVKDIAFIMNLTPSRVFQIIKSTMPKIFKDTSVDIKGSFYIYYAMHKRITPISFFPYKFEKDVQKDIDYLFLIYVRSVIELYLSTFHYKDELLTSNIMQIANESFNNKGINAFEKN